MELEMAAGFAAVCASLLAIALLVLASRKTIEKTHRKNLAEQQGDDGNRGNAR